VTFKMLLLLVVFLTFMSGSSLFNHVTVTTDSTLFETALSHHDSKNRVNIRFSICATPRPLNLRVLSKTSNVALCESY
jgi:hypothetical protein